jgi:hypothetical protein
LDLDIWYQDFHSRDGLPVMKFEMEWPRYPLLTPTGKESLAKTAGRPLPWLSANYINRVGHRQHRALVALWRGQAEVAAFFLPAWERAPKPCYLDIVLYRRQGHKMDSYAILEGMKPIIDGMVLAQLFPDDTQEFILGGIARSEKSIHPGLTVTFRPLPTGSALPGR